MTTEVEPTATFGDRLTFALRQAALLAIALFVAGAVTERLRPEVGFARGIADTPFLWAIVIWVVLLVFHAAAFTTSHMADLEGRPLIAALIIGAVITLIGVVSLEEGSAARRFVFVLANGVGAGLFWWAVIGLGYLIVRRLRV